MTTLSAIRPKPKQAPPKTEPQPAPTDLHDDALNLTDADLGTDVLDSFFDDEREAPGVADTQDAPKAKKKGFLGNLFGGGNDAEDEEDEPDFERPEMSQEMYEFTAEAATEITDQIFSNVNNTLNDTDNPAQWQANDREKSRLQKAWMYYVRSKQLTMSPLAYLVWTIFMIYGVGTLFGVVAWFGRVRKFGLHWPWSKKWKAQAQEIPTEQYAPPTAQPSSAPTNVYQRVMSTEPPKKSPETSTPSTQANAPAEALGYKRCLQTGQPFKAGEGHPKKWSQAPHLVDSFATKSAYFQYANQQGYLGYRRKLKEQATDHEQTA